MRLVLDAALGLLHHRLLLTARVWGCLLSLERFEIPHSCCRECPSRLSGLSGNLWEPTPERWSGKTVAALVLSGSRISLIMLTEVLRGG